MNTVLQKIYWNSPYFVKRRLASFSARKMDRQRFGREYDKIILEIEKRTSFSQEQFLDYQEDEFKKLVRHAYVNVPYYRKLFNKIGICPEDIGSLDDITKIPILEKQMLRGNCEDFVDERLDKNSLIKMCTSGTTGTPIDLYRDVWLNSAAFAYIDERWHSVAGMRRRDNRSVSIGGSLVTSPQRNKPPFWVENRLWNQLYMSSYHLSPSYLGYYVEKLRKYKADYIEGYSSSVYTIAQYIVEQALSPIEFKACFTTAETLFDYQREIIEKAFCCKVYDQYGCGEMAVFAAECQAGSMHLSPEIGIVEVLDDHGDPVEAGQTGHFVCTSLINKVQPFIRYRIGDIGSFKDGKCSCGSVLPMLGHIEGRTDAMLVAFDGRRIGRVSPIFKGVDGIAEAQIIQNDRDKFIIRIVAGKDYSAISAQKVIEKFKYRFGDVQVKVETVEKIERTEAGKFRAVINNCV